MSNSPNLISLKETAKILGVSTRQVQRKVNQGLLKAHYSGKYTLFDSNDVYDLAELEASKPPLAKIAAVANRANLSAQRTERIVDRLLTALGVDYPKIPLDKEGVIALHIKAEDALKEFIPCPLDQVSEWTRIFDAIGEEYFAAVEEYTGSKEPWAVYTNLAARLSSNFVHGEVLDDREIRVVYGCLEKARQAIRRTAFFYIQNKYGLSTARKSFPEVKLDVHEDILSLALAVNNEDNT